jgi:hypothetical protein
MTNIVYRAKFFVAIHAKMRDITRTARVGRNRGIPQKDTNTMTNVETTGTESTKRKGVAKHEFIDAAGNVVGISQGVGIKYTDKASGKAFSFPIPGAQPGTALTMLALFGAKTKATNETSRLRNGDAGVTDPDEQIAALQDAFTQIGNNVWRESAVGEGTGSRADKPTLAAALIEALGTGAKGTVDDYVAKMADEEYLAKVFGNKAVKAIYLAMRAKARAGNGVADSLDSLA